MTTQREGALKVLLAVRLRQQAIEERRLADLMHRSCCAQADARRAEAAFDVILTRRREDVQVLRRGAEHQENEAIYRELLVKRADARAYLDGVEQMRHEQLTAYYAARCNREVMSRLIDRRMSLYQFGVERNEQKRLDDLSAARAGRKEDIGEYSGFVAEEGSSSFQPGTQVRGLKGDEVIVC